MGTRSSTLIQVDGEIKLAQYTQFDGYPSSLGVSILELLRTVDLTKLKERVRGLKFAGPESEDEDDPEWQEYMKHSDECDQNLLDILKLDISDWVDAKEAKKQKSLSLPGFRWSRECGGDGIIKMLLNENLTFGTVMDRSDFVVDSLFCEWAYLIDFDRNKLEVYEGFNQEPLASTERFAHLNIEGSEYYPVKFVVEYDLSNLPTDQDFCSEIEALTRDAGDEESQDETTDESGTN